jgi:uncharacterized protein involved in exopolysaccharide biosynthesis
MLPVPTQAPRAAPTPRTVLVPLFKDLPKLVLTFLLVMGAAGAVAWLMAPSYVAEALLYVKYGREYTYRTETGEAQIIPQSSDPKQAVKSEIRILGAPILAGEVVARLGVQTLYPELLARPSEKVPPADAAQRRFSSNLKAETGEDGHVIAVTFQHPEALVAARALGELVNAYMASRRLLFAESRAESLRPEVETARTRLAGAEAALAAYRSGNGIVSFDAQRALLLERTDGLRTQLNDAEREQAGLVERVAQLRAELKATPDTLVLHAESGDNEALDSGRATLLQLRLEERKLLAEYSEASREVREIRKRLDQAERFVSEQAKRPKQLVRRGRNPVYDTLVAQLSTAEADLVAVKGHGTVLERQLAAAGEELGLLDARSVEIARLTRERDLAEASYQLVAQKLDEAKVLDEVAMRDDANVRVVQPARVSAVPRDLRPLVLALGFLVASVTTLLVAFLSDLLRGGFLTPEQLERETGLPVLAAFPVRRMRPWGAGLELHGPGTLRGPGTFAGWSP